MTDAEREVEQKYAGRFFYKKARTIEGDKKTIRIDKIEQTLKYKLIHKKLELLVAEKFTGDKKNYYGAWFYEPLQIMDYAFICDKWLLYHCYKKEILREVFGIDYLSFLELNP